MSICLLIHSNFGFDGSIMGEGYNVVSFNHRFKIFYYCNIEKGRGAEPTRNSSVLISLFQIRTTTPNIGILKWESLCWDNSSKSKLSICCQWFYWQYSPFQPFQIRLFLGWRTNSVNGDGLMTKVHSNQIVVINVFSFTSTREVWEWLQGGRYVREHALVKNKDFKSPI